MLCKTHRSLNNSKVGSFGVFPFHPFLGVLWEASLFPVRSVSGSFPNAKGFTGDLPRNPHSPPG